MTFYNLLKITPVIYIRIQVIFAFLAKVNSHPWKIKPAQELVAHALDLITGATENRRLR